MNLMRKDIVHDNLLRIIVCSTQLYHVLNH